MIEIYSSKEDLQQYKDAKAVSYSLLKALMSGSIEGLLEEKKTMTTETTIGSLVDYMITRNTPWEEEFVLSSNNTPTDNINTVIKSVIPLAKEAGVSELLTENEADEFYLPTALNKCRELGFYSNRKDETIKKMFLDEIVYFRTLMKDDQRIPITQEILEFSTLLAEKIKTFLNFSQLKNATIYYQFPYYFEIDNILCKALPDIVIKGEYYTDIIDIKTSSEFPLGFDRSFYMFGYHIQFALFAEAIKEENNPRLRILAASNKNLNYNPLYYKIEQSCVNRALNGIPNHCKLAFNNNETFDIFTKGYKGIRDVLPLANEVMQILKDDNASKDYKRQEIYKLVNRDITRIVNRVFV